MRALLGAEVSSYEELPSKPVGFQQSLVALPNNREAPQELVSMLDAEAQEFLQDPHGKMMLAATSDVQEPIKPYLDPALRRRRTFERFVRVLFDQHIIGFTTERKADAGLFFVPKKDHRMRMVVDARPGNTFFRAPP